MIPLTITSMVGAVVLAFTLGGAVGFLKGIGHEHDKQTRVALSQSEHNRELERLANRANGKVDRDYQAKIIAAGAAAASTRAQRDRLLVAIAALPAVPDPSASACGALGERAASLGRLLGEAAELAREGGERVGAVTAKLGALQARETGVNQLLVTP